MQFIERKACEILCGVSLNYVSVQSLPLNKDSMEIRMVHVLSYPDLSLVYWSYNLSRNQTLALMLATHASLAKLPSLSKLQVLA